MTRAEIIRDAFRNRRTDKANHGYALVYAKVPEDISSVLEIGISEGRSLLAWTDIFPSAQVWGIELRKLFGINLHRLNKREARFTRLETIESPPCSTRSRRRSSPISHQSGSRTACSTVRTSISSA